MMDHKRPTNRTFTISADLTITHRLTSWNFLLNLKPRQQKAPSSQVSIGLFIDSNVCNLPILWVQWRTNTKCAISSKRDSPRIAPSMQTVRHPSMGQRWKRAKKRKRQGSNKGMKTVNRPTKSVLYRGTLVKTRVCKGLVLSRRLKVGQKSNFSNRNSQVHPMLRMKWSQSRWSETGWARATLRCSTGTKIAWRPSARASMLTITWWYAIIITLCHFHRLRRPLNQGL